MELQNEKTFLFRLAHNLAIDWLRRRKVRWVSEEQLLKELDKAGQRMPGGIHDVRVEEPRGLGGERVMDPGENPEVEIGVGCVREQPPPDEHAGHNQVVGEVKTHGPGHEERRARGEGEQPEHSRGAAP